MRRLLVLPILLFLFPLALRAADAPRQTLAADLNWRFYLGDNADAAKPEFDDSSWRKLNLPHDWSIEGPFDQNAPASGQGGYLPTGIGWYRRHFVAPESFHNKKVFIEFDGVYMNSDVTFNGQHLGNQPFGYTGFQYDLTPYLKMDGKDNVIAVRVDNSAQPSSRWYTGSGIYRHVWVNVMEPVHVARLGTYITTPKVSSQAATVSIRTTLQNDSDQARSVRVSQQVADLEGKNGGSVTPSDVNIPANGKTEVTQSVEISNPQLWSVEKPALYQVQTIIKNGDEAVDSTTTTIGIRDIHYDGAHGFLLNGTPVKMLGMCIHADGGAVGAAVPAAVWERRLQVLKSMGCNALRMSHNPPDPALLDLCDKLGFLVMDEAFDEWTAAKGQLRGSYSKYFQDWSQKDLIAMLHRDRNHPSVVMWSVGNEIPEQTRANGINILQPLVDTCHREDPTRPVTSACDNAFAEPNHTRPEFLAALDVPGYNYVDRWGTHRETFFDDAHRDFPQKALVGTEDSGVGGTRGDYRFAPGESDTSFRASYTASMIRAEQLWKFNKTHDYVAGYFMWTGIDYLGEARWPRKGASSGAIDMCAFPKDGYYFYQSQWTTAPMIHLLPHWNWKGREGQITPVLAYTNCDSVELFLNGKSFGSKTLEFPRQGTSGGWNSYARPQLFPTTADLHLSWDVPYEAGTLKAVGRKANKVVCTEEVKTAGEPAAIVLTVDRDKLNADGRDVAHFMVKIVDAQGIAVPTANSLITFDVQGAGRLIGVDNGDPASHESYQINKRNAFNGLALALVQTQRAAGKIRVTARADGLKESSVEIEATQVPPTPTLD